MKYNIKGIIEYIKENAVMVRWAALFVLFVWFLVAQVQVVPGLLAKIVLFAGLLLLVLDIVLEWRSLAAFFAGRNTKKGLRLSATLFLTAAILGLVYYLFVRQITFRVDLTSNQRFSLSEQTLLALEELKEPVKFWIFKMEVPHNANPVVAQNINRGLEIVREMEEVLKDYGRRNSHVTHEVVDIQEEPERASEFEVRSPWTVVVAAGRKTRQLTPNDYFVPTQTARGTEPVPQFEECFTTAISTLTRQKTWTIVFTSGHLERSPEDEGDFGASALNERLFKEGFTTLCTNLLLAGGVPEGCDLLVLAGPKDDFHEQELDYIEGYLMQGKPAFFMAAQDAKPNYRALVSRWGIDIGAAAIYDPEKMLVQQELFSGRRFLRGFIPSIEPHRITRGLSEDTQRLVYLTFSAPLFRSQAAEDRGDEKTGAKFARYSMYSLLKSTPSAWEESDLRAPRQDAGERQGPFDAALVITVPPERREQRDGQETVTQAGPAKELNLAVFGDTDFIVNAYIQPGNMDLFLATVNWAIGQEGRIAISPKVPRSYPIRLTEGEDNFIKYFAVVVMPIIVIITGVVVYFRRKRYGAA